MACADRALFDHACKGETSCHPKVLSKQGEPQDSHPVPHACVMASCVLMSKVKLKLCNRKDKYEKHLLWYWVDTAYTGKQKSTDMEELSRQTELGETSISTVPLGLSRPATKRGGPAPPDSEDESDDHESIDQESSEESDEERPDSEMKSSRKSSKCKQPKAKKSKSFEEEYPEQASQAIVCTCTV